jgi:hypothetical protein
MLWAEKPVLFVTMSEIKVELLELVLWFDVLREFNRFSGVIFFCLKDYSGLEFVQKFNRGEPLIVFEIPLGPEL